MAESVSNLVQAAAAPGELPAKAAPQQANPFGRKRNEIPTAEELLANINRALPFSDEGEKGVLSSLLQDPNERLSESRVSLPAAAFYHEANRTIYEKLLEFYDKNLPVDPVMVTNALRDQGLLERVGGPAAITELFTFVPSPSHYTHYKKIVLDKYILRQLIHACSLNIHQSYEFGKEQLDDDVSTLIDHAEQRVLAVRESTGKQEGLKTLASHVAEAIDSI